MTNDPVVTKTKLWVPDQTRLRRMQVNVQVRKRKNNFRHCSKLRAAQGDSGVQKPWSRRRIFDEGEEAVRVQKQ